MENQTVQGTVNYWNLPKGYGFIRADDGGKDVFCHIAVSRQALVVGQRVEFEPAESKKGRHAKSIRIV